MEHFGRQIAEHVTCVDPPTVTVTEVTAGVKFMSDGEGFPVEVGGTHNECKLLKMMLE